MYKTLLTGLTLLLIAFSARGACPAGTNLLGEVEGKEACGLRGRYKSQRLYLTSDKLWVLQQGVFIGGDNKDNSTLEIQAGTKIVGQAGADFLVITRGSKILARGTAQNPIIFSSSKPMGERAPGDWGGLIINGNAPINKCTVSGPVCQTRGEGSTGLYGGDQPFDSSGSLRYVVVEFAGFLIAPPDKELNGIAFQGVGAGTEVEYVQAHRNADDGVEFFGGTVSARYLVLSGNEDDSLDWTNGWTGKVQFALIQQLAGPADNGIEADNNSKQMDASPRANPTLSNLTLLGSATDGKGHGILLRKGTAASIHNTVISSFRGKALDIDNRATFAQASQGNISLRNVVIDSRGGTFSNEDEDPFALEDFFLEMSGNMLVNPMLEGVIPMSGSPLMVAKDITPMDLWFSPVDYIGAVRDASDTWYGGWTSNLRK